jgi:hypothetical protein
MAATNPKAAPAPASADDETKKVATNKEAKRNEPAEPDPNTYDPDQEAKPFYTDAEGTKHERPKLTAFRKLKGMFDGGSYWEEMADYIEKSEGTSEKAAGEKAANIAVKAIEDEAKSEKEKLDAQIDKITKTC